MTRKDTSSESTVDVNLRGEIIDNDGELSLLITNKSGKESVWDANGFMRYALKTLSKTHESFDNKILVRIHVHSLDADNKCELARYLDM